MKTKLSRLLLCVVAVVILVLPLNLQARRFARWWTTMGSFTADLRDELVPITANNFINLTNNGFYNGLHFHRVLANFVIQDGCPLGTGYGGPGYTIQDEFNPNLHHDSAGVLAMARTSAPNSAGSQYYITLVPTPHLDGNYAVFGKVFEGLDVVLAIGQVAVDGASHPITNVYIDSLKILNMAINSVSPSVETVQTFDVTNPYPFVVEAFGYYENVNFAWYIDDVLQPQFSDFMMEPTFTTSGMHTVTCINTDSELTWNTTWQVDVSTVHNTDATYAPPNISLAKTYPNPFNEQAVVSFKANEISPLCIKVYDTKGRLIQTEKLMTSKGQNEWVWNPHNSIASGIYFIKLTTVNEQHTQKVVLIR